MIERDIRASSAGEAVYGFYRTLFRPGEGHVWTAADLSVSADGATVYFTGLCFEGALEDGPSSAIYRLDSASGTVVRLAAGRLFRCAADGHAVYVEDRDDRNRLVIVAASGDLIRAIPINGKVETIAWSPSGRDLLVLVADGGADLAGVEGGCALLGSAAGAGWLPEVTSTGAQDVWRRLYRWSVGAVDLAPVTHPPVNVWEAAWLGDAAIIVIASDHHGEGSWYQASLRVLDAVSGTEHTRYHPREQIGVPAGAPDGRRWAAIEAFCSDRGLVCGAIILNELGGARRVLDVAGVEVTDICWRDRERLLFVGLRAAQTVAGDIHVITGERRELWASEVLTISGWCPRATPLGKDAALAVIEGYVEPPHIARLQSGGTVVLASFAPTPAPAIPGTMRPYRWRGRDGLEIGGWLVLPQSDSKGVPLLLDIHGGPVWAHRNRYAANLRAGPVLVGWGYALLLPNPRGSSGHGQDFARAVRGDMGGEDMHDHLAGIDQLVADGIVDPACIAVSGTSYGGFMSGWLVTQTRRFAAAVPISPISNWFSQHFASQVPSFDEAFLQGSPREAGECYFARSPVFFAHGATTPTLVLAGGRDKNTPTGQATELYGAFAQAGVDAALAIYPNDGHSLRGYPAYIDSAARIVDWLKRHIKS